MLFPVTARMEYLSAREAVHLFSAAQRGDVAAIAKALGPATEELRDERGRSLLHEAASNGHVEVVRLLGQRDRSASAAAIDIEGATPLHLAVRGGHEGAARVLLTELGADALAVSKNTGTAAHVAASYGYTNLLRMLVREFGGRRQCVVPKWPHISARGRR